MNVDVQSSARRWNLVHETNLPRTPIADGPPLAKGESVQVVEAAAYDQLTDDHARVVVERDEAHEALNDGALALLQRAQALAAQYREALAGVSAAVAEHGVWRNGVGATEMTPEFRAALNNARVALAEEQATAGESRKVRASWVAARVYSRFGRLLPVESSSKVAPYIFELLTAAETARDTCHVAPVTTPRNAAEMVTVDVADVRELLPWAQAAADRNGKTAWVEKLRGAIKRVSAVLDSVAPARTLTEIEAEVEASSEAGRQAVDVVRATDLVLPEDGDRREDLEHTIWMNLPGRVVHRRDARKIYEVIREAAAVVATKDG